MAANRDGHLFVDTWSRFRLRLFNLLKFIFVNLRVRECAFYFSKKLGQPCKSSDPTGTYFSKREF